MLLILLGAGIAAIVDPSGTAVPGGIPAPAALPAVAEAAPVPADADPKAAGRARVADTLRIAVRRAARPGDRLRAAVMVDGWSGPVQAVSTPARAMRRMRMWSISKVATAVTLLRRLGWGDAPGARPSAEVRSALAGALTRSENCRQRRVVLALQEASGSTANAAAALDATFAVAGTDPVVARATQGPDPVCVSYLSQQHGVRAPMAPALMLGTSRWSISDAARFAHAVGDGRYGSALTREVLRLMRAPKARSREGVPGDFTALPEWGAGRALACLRPAYKAGWGGVVIGRFAATQIAVVSPGGRTGAIAVAFEPATQPPRDDPGLTEAPEAIERVMRALAPALGAPEGGCAA